MAGSARREETWRDEAPGIWSDGLRAKLGARHLPLDSFVSTFLDAGLRIERFEEPRARDYPQVVAPRARR